jgi:hypothetical protein
MLSSESAPSALAPRFTRRTKLQDAPPAQIDDGVALSVKIAKTRVSGQSRVLTPFKSADDVLQRLVHETVIAYRKDFLTAFQYCSNLVQDVEAAFGSVDVGTYAPDLVPQYAECSIDRPRMTRSGFRPTLLERFSLFGSLSRFDTFLDFWSLATLSSFASALQLHHILQNFDSLLDIGEFKMAASAVMQMVSSGISNLFARRHS